MNTAPLVSVVMSVYNGEKYLTEAIESILSQTFHDFEFIIINDGSIDNTAAILERYARGDSRIHIYHQENKGLIASLNKGCALAQGKYIARMDADDVALQHRFRAQVDFLEDRPDVALLGSAITLIDSEGRQHRITRYPTTDRSIRRVLRHGNCFAHPTVMMRRQAVSDVGGYRECFSPAEDYDLWLRLADRFEMANLAEPLLLYRIHSRQATSRDLGRTATLTLAAQAAARMRRENGHDPLVEVKEITPEILGKLGITATAIEEATVRTYVAWAGTMLLIRDEAAAFQLLTHAASLARKAIHARHLLAAVHKAYLRANLTQGRYRAACVSAAKVCFLEPIFAVMLPWTGIRFLWRTSRSIILSKVARRRRE